MKTKYIGLLLLLCTFGAAHSYTTSYPSPYEVQYTITDADFNNDFKTLLIFLPANRFVTIVNSGSYANYEVKTMTYDDDFVPSQALKFNIYSRSSAKILGYANDYIIEGGQYYAGRGYHSTGIDCSFRFKPGNMVSIFIPIGESTGSNKLQVTRTY